MFIKQLDGSIKSVSDYSVKCGNLWCDITDHLPNYFLLLSNQNKGNSIARPFVRIFSKSIIEQFIKTVRDCLSVN